MSDINIQQLLRDANNIRTEKDPGDNDAERVGKMFVDIIEYLRTHSGSGSGEGGDTPTPTPTPTPGGNTFNNGIVVTAGGASINGTTNITGALNVNGNITGKVITGDQLNSNGTITAKGDIIGHGGLEVENDIRTNTGSISAPNGTVSAQKAVFDYLTVNKSAHFFELVLDQLRANKGAILITNGQCKADDVETLTNRYRIYYRAQDDATENPKAIHQSFIVGDLAICQTFGDGVKVGTNTNITTTYYWRAVSAVSVNPVQRSDGKLYHWIELSNVSGRYDQGSGTPKIGDEIVQLGYNPAWSSNPLEGNDLVSRQSAIILSAYPTKDAGVVPPSLAFYQGINDFTLSSHRATFIDTTGGHFKGVIEAGSSVAPGTELDVNTESYQLIPSNNPIVKNANASQNITFSVFKSDGSSGDILDHDQLVTEGLKCDVSLNGNTSTLPTPATGNVFKVALAANTTGQLELILKDSSNNMKTKFVTTIVNLGTVTNGVNGQYTQIIFKNAATKPDAPANGSSSIGTWSNGPSTPSSGQTIWVCTRVVEPQANGTIVYYNWSDVVQFNGTNGINGTNGTNGSNGTNGEDGDPGESWTLAAIAEAFEVRIAHGEHRKLENVVGTLYTNLTYSLIHTVGDAPEVLENLTGYTITIESDNTAGTASFTPTVNQGVITFVPTDNNLLKQILVAAGNTDQWNYYWLYDHKDEVSTYNNNRWGQFMPTKLTVTVTKNGALLASRVVPLIFSAQGYFGALQDGLISIYQGLSGNTDTNWQTGFSQIKQTWDNISLSVSNIETQTGLGDFVSTDTQQYIYRKLNLITASVPTLPSRDSDIKTADTGLYWTTKSDMAVNSSYPVIYYSVRTRVNNASDWGEWSYPRVYKYWDGTKVVMGTTIMNSADIDIAATRIKNTVQTTINGINESISEIDQKADTISLSVTQKTAGNKNYLVHSSFEDASLLASNWEKKDNGVVNTTLIHSVWRGAANVNSPAVPMTLTRTGSTSINVNVPSSKCAVLSSYAAVALNDSSTARCNVRQIVTVSQNQYYTFSIWVKRALRLEEKTCTIRLNIGNVSAAGKAAAFNSSDGKLECGQGASSTGIIVSGVTSESSNCYVDFTLLDDNWHQLVLEVRPAAEADAATAEIVVLGTKDTFREVFVSRPMLAQGISLSAGTSESIYMNEDYAKPRIYNYSEVTNLLSNTALSTVEEVYAWIKVMSAGGKYIMWDGTQISHDDISADILSRQWSVTDYPNALQMSGTVAALAFSNDTGYRVANTPHIYQHFTKDFAASIQNDWLVFSVYVRRKASWANKVYNGSTLRTPLQFALLGQAIDKNSMEAGFETGVNKGGQTTVNNPVNSVIQRYVIDAVDSDWHRIWLKFKIDKTTANENALLKGFGVGFWINVETDGVGEDWLVVKPKLEIGEVPSMWTDNSDDIKSGLSRTGIDISAGKINLQADKVTFSNSSGTVTDKISIDPTTGTLNAVDGNFSGVVTANTTYSPFVDINLDEFVGSYYDIDPTEGSNYYLPPAPLNTSHYVRLPNSTTFDGLKLLIFSSRSTRSGVGTNLLQYSGGIRYLHPTYKDYYLSATALQMQYNTLVEVIAIGRQWYVLRGRFSVDGGTTWFDV